MTNKRSGHPVTVTTPEFRQNVNSFIRLEKGAPIRKTDVIVKRERFISSKSSVHQTAKKLKVNGTKRKKHKKLTDIDK